jgi:hypothetical protein
MNSEFDNPKCVSTSEAAFSSKRAQRSDIDAQTLGLKIAKVLVFPTRGNGFSFNPLMSGVCGRVGLISVERLDVPSGAWTVVEKDLI